MRVENSTVDYIICCVSSGLCSFNCIFCGVFGLRSDAEFTIFLVFIRLHNLWFSDCITCGVSGLRSVARFVVFLTFSTPLFKPKVLYSEIVCPLTNFVVVTSRYNTIVVVVQVQYF